MTVVQKFLRAIDAMGRDRVIELHDLETQRRLFRGVLNTSGPLQKSARLEYLVELAVRISQAFDVVLRCPPAYSPKDSEALQLLNDILDGKSDSISTMGWLLTKTVENENPLELGLQQGEMAGLAISFTNPGIRATIFGETFPVGPVIYFIDRAAFLNSESALDAWRGASLGDTVEFLCKPLTPVRILRLPDAAKLTASDVAKLAEVARGGE